MNSADRRAPASIVDIIDFEDSASAARYQPLTNNEELLIKEIESQEEESGLEDLCEVDRHLIAEEARGLSEQELRAYLSWVCGYYSQRVGILMKHVYRAIHPQTSGTSNYLTLHQLNQTLDECRIFETRLKELEIENTQLRKLKPRLEEAETKLRAVDTKVNFYKGLLENGIDPVVSMSIEDLEEWENKVCKLTKRIAERKSDIVKELVAKTSVAPKCIICQVLPVSTVIRDCNHACLCWECSLTLDKCPFDRKKISSVDRIYLP